MHAAIIIPAPTRSLTSPRTSLQRGECVSATPNRYANAPIVFLIHQSPPARRDAIVTEADQHVIPLFGE